MKKSVKLAALLLALVLITSMAVSGTFAKYVTETSAADKARVAKFGVLISAKSNYFDAEYDISDTTEGAGLTCAVQAKLNEDGLTRDNVVAPGTNSDDVDDSIVFSISGTPEVAVDIDVNMTVNNDIFLKAGTWVNTTVQPFNNDFTLATDYYPVVFTLTQTADANGTITDPVQIAQGNLNAIKTALYNYSDNPISNSHYNPNTNLAATFKLSWTWNFTGNDKADTLLSNLPSPAYLNTYNSAGNFTASVPQTTDYSLEVDFTLAITVTQID